MKLVIGLGNPGLEYVNTRHNTGFLFVDELKKVNKSANLQIHKSDSFMNESGVFVNKLVQKYNLDLSNLFIVHDDLDIALGEYKIQSGKGPKDHNGLRSIDEELGSDQYWHIRIGVDNRPADNRPLGEEYVLQDFSNVEKNILEKVIKQACKKLETLLTNTK